MLTVWNAFNDLLGDEFVTRPLQQQRRFVPAVDVSEDETAFVIRADVPGLSPEDIEVTVESNVLTLRGERKSERKHESKGYHRVERHYGSFQRSFNLPEGVNADAIQAAVEHGTLTLTIPKPVAELPKKVKVNLGGKGKTPLEPKPSGEARMQA